MSVKNFITEHYKHFNAAALIDAAKGYEKHLSEGKQMHVSLAGAMSTAELGKSFAEMIRQKKVAIVSCTGANLEEDLMNLVAHSHYKRVPEYRDLTPKQEKDLLAQGLNRVTDTCIPEEEAFRKVFLKKYSITRVPLSLYRYRQHPKNRSKNKKMVKLYRSKFKNA